jgi:hypothetical protein
MSPNPKRQSSVAHMSVTTFNLAGAQAIAIRGRQSNWSVSPLCIATAGAAARYQNAISD